MTNIREALQAVHQGKHKPQPEDAHQSQTCRGCGEEECACGYFRRGWQAQRREGAWRVYEGGRFDTTVSDRAQAKTYIDHKTQEQTDAA